MEDDHHPSQELSSVAGHSMSINSISKPYVRTSTSVRSDTPNSKRHSKVGWLSS